MNADFPGLSQLFGGYRHQQWPEEHGGVWSAVGAYRDDETPEGVGRARAELADLLSRPLPDDELADLLAALGCSYWPPADGYSLRGWLQELLARLAPAE